MASEFADPGVLALAQNNLFNDRAQSRIERIRERRKEYDKLYGLAHGLLKDKTFFVDKTEYAAKRANEFLPKVKEELDADQTWLDEFDGTVFKVHYAMAKELGAGPADELVGRYKFHQDVQLLLANFQNGASLLQAIVNQIAGQRNIEQNQFQDVLTSFREIHTRLAEDLRNAKALHLPALKNMEPNQSLGRFLWSKPLPAALPTDVQSLDGAWIGAMFGACRQPKSGNVREAPAFTITSTTTADRAAISGSTRTRSPRFGTR